MGQSCYSNQDSLHDNPKAHKSTAESRELERTILQRQSESVTRAVDKEAKTLTRQPRIDRLVVEAFCEEDSADQPSSRTEFDLKSGTMLSSTTSPRSPPPSSNREPLYQSPTPPRHHHHRPS